MIISVLAENTACNPNGKRVRAEHGLSLYIETNGQKILFDTGQSDLFAQNAQKMGIDLSEVDYLFISHGHLDHGGGLKHFLEANSDARIFLHKKAAGKFYTKLLGFIPYYVGLNQKVIRQSHDRIEFIEEDTAVSDTVQIITGFSREFPLPSGNASLFEKQDKRFIRDEFQHEIVLILKEGSASVVFTACSHSGIVNMVKRATEVVGEGNVKAVFGGFHTYNPVSRRNESKEYLERLTSEIEEYDSVFYTGHCTGLANFSLLKRGLGAKIQSMNCGEVIEI